MRIEIDETVGDTRNTLRTVEPASFRFTDVDGGVFAAGGAFRSFTTTTPSTYMWRTEIEGLFHYPTAGGWLGTGVSGALTWAGQDAGGTREVAMSGGLSVVDHAIFFHEVRWDPAVCEEAPAVVLEVRHASGQWYLFSTEGCGACGSVSFRGEALGTACPDLATPVRAAVLAAGERW